MTGRYIPDSVTMHTISVLTAELWRMRNLNIAEENKTVCKWIEDRIRSLKEGK